MSKSLKVISTKAGARGILGKRIVGVAFRRKRAKCGTWIAEPIIHLADGTTLVFEVQEVEGRQAVRMSQTILELFKDL